MADLVFIVSRAEPKHYLYLKHEFADESSDVVLDRRAGERRRSQRHCRPRDATCSGAIVT